MINMYDKIKNLLFKVNFYFSIAHSNKNKMMTKMFSFKHPLNAVLSWMEKY